MRDTTAAKYQITFPLVCFFCTKSTTVFFFFRVSLLPHHHRFDPTIAACTTWPWCHQSHYGDVRCPAERGEYILRDNRPRFNPITSMALPLEAAKPAGVIAFTSGLPSNGCAQWSYCQWKFCLKYCDLCNWICVHNSFVRNGNKFKYLHLNL